MKKFPSVISFTVTNLCNLRCKMCGQWGNSGYLKDDEHELDHLPVDIWEKVVDEIAENKDSIICLRGGEPFLYPEIIELLTYIKEKSIYVTIDTNGTLLKKYAKDIVRLNIDNITVSVDGPSVSHDQVRGMQGCFDNIEEGVLAVKNMERNLDRESCIKSLCFVISPYSYKGLVEMPEVARKLEISKIAVVPYYYLDNSTGQAYENIMKEKFDCSCFSWKGFCREESGVDVEEFIKLFREFKEELKEIELVPYMNFSEEDYRAWFDTCKTGIGKDRCNNPLSLIDIQPNGDMNFCVDFPDYILGNIMNDSIADVWQSDRAEKFREYIRTCSLPVCQRCGAKYMTD